MLGNETIKYFAPRATDAHGDPVGLPPEPVEIEGCVVFPRTTEEASGTASTIITGLQCLAPRPAESFDTKGQVGYRGKVYEIEGDIGQWTYLDGDDAGSQLRLERGSDR